MRRILSLPELKRIHITECPVSPAVLNCLSSNILELELCNIRALSARSIYLKDKPENRDTSGKETGINWVDNLISYTASSTERYEKTGSANAASGNTPDRQPRTISKKDFEKLLDRCKKLSTFKLGGFTPDIDRHVVKYLKARSRFKGKERQNAVVENGRKIWLCTDSNRQDAICTQEFTTLRASWPWSVSSVRDFSIHCLTTTICAYIFVGKLLTCKLLPQVSA